MNYRTILNDAEHEIVVKKSRFIGHVKPINSEEEAQAFIEEIKKKHWNARHNVPVYVLGHKYDLQRYSDDGEPSGTAGIPILEMLKKEHITNIAVVITRYFGGIKLGTGGLVRAYTQSAKETLQKVGVVDVEEYTLLSIICDYSLHGKIQNFIMNDYYIVESTEFKENVVMRVYCKPADSVGVTQEMMEISNGLARVTKIRNDVLAVKEKEYIIV